MVRALTEPGAGARPEPGTTHEERAPSFRPLNLAAPSPPPWRGDPRVPFGDALLLPIDDFQLQPADSFFRQFDGPRELASLHESVERAAAEAGQTLYLWTAKNGLDRLDHFG